MSSEDGKTRQTERRFRGTKTQAQKLLLELQKEAEEKRQANLQAPDTLRGLVADWLDALTTAGRSVKTIDSYRIVAAVHLIPFFGERKLVSEITTRDVDRYYAAKARQGLAPRTILQHGGILSSALSQAVKWNMIATNPCANANRPKPPPEDPNPPSVEQVRALRKAIDDDIDFSTALAVASLVGGRRGELCGLQWKDVDWVEGTLSIERQRVPVKGGNVTKPPKGNKTRKVAVNARTLDLLRTYDMQLDKRAADLGIERPPDGGWLLSYDCGHTPMRPQTLGERITALGKKAGIPVTTHDFRKFAATQLIGDGTDIRTAAGRLGHTPEVMLRVYAGFLPQKDREAAERLEAKLLD